LQTKYFIIFCFLILFVSSCKTTPKQFVETGDEKRVALDFNGAIIDYSSAIKEKPALHQAWHNRGECQMQLGQYKLALIDFNETLKLKPDFVSAIYNKGLCLIKLKKYTEALKCIDIACKMDTSIKADLTYANCYFYLGYNREAVHYFTKSLITMPDSSGLYLGRGIANYQLENLEACKLDLAKYIEMGGLNPICFRQLGLVYLKSGNNPVYIDSAIVCLELFTTQNKTIDKEASKALVLSYLARGKNLMEMEKEIDALADISKAIELDPSNAEALFQRGKIMISLGQTADGCLDLQSALKNGNTNAEKLIGIYCGDVL
jgi:tetratricopeptide (TPR) repeat protein